MLKSTRFGDREKKTKKKKNADGAAGKEAPKLLRRKKGVVAVQKMCLEIADNEFIVW